MGPFKNSAVEYAPADTSQNMDFIDTLFRAKQVSLCETHLQGRAAQKDPQGELLNSLAHCFIGATV